QFRVAAAGFLLGRSVRRRQESGGRSEKPESPGRERRSVRRRKGLRTRRREGEKSAKNGLYRASLSLRLRLLRVFAFSIVCVLGLWPIGCVRFDGHGEQRHARAPGDPIVIRFWNGFTGPDGKTMEALVYQFQEANPDVRVRMQIIPWGTYYDKLTLSLAYGG